MGRRNTVDEQRATLEWAKTICKSKNNRPGPRTVADLRTIFGNELRRYFALAALSRSKTAPEELVLIAKSLVFNVRVVLEKDVGTAFVAMVESGGLNMFDFRQEPLHGYSKKQGVSIRMPLSSCMPSKICGAACYAHDVLDAAPSAVIRGAVNGAIATIFERSNLNDRVKVLNHLKLPIARMIRAARSDAQSAANVFERRPRIRFAHVGEFSAFPDYANALARRVREESGGEVDCVVYTRHPNASRLDPDLFVVLFSLDESSESRRRFVPPTARVVRSAFGGHITDTVDVNFLEHHRWAHFPPTGTGKVCPSTAPQTKVRTCDACKCDFCFKPKRPSPRLPLT
jgi:hypothetical protein